MKGQFCKVDSGLPACPACLASPGDPSERAGRAGRNDNLHGVIPVKAGIYTPSGLKIFQNFRNCPFVPAPQGGGDNFWCVLGGIFWDNF